MKLCIVTRNVMKGDGQSHVNYEITWEAIYRGYQVTLLATSVALELQQSHQVSWIYIPVEKLPTQLFQGIIFSWYSANWLRQHRSNFNIILINGASTQEAADINVVHFVHSAWLRSPVHPWRLRRDRYGAYQWLYTRLNAHWEKQAFKKAKAIVTVSEKVKQELADIDIEKARISVILNGVDLQEFALGSADRSQLGLPEGVTLALFVGDIRTARKNLDTVLHALVDVPQLHLAVAGAAERSPYPQLTAELGLGDRVHFLGFRQDISAIMKAVDFFVFPSRYEPFGMVVSEAMATGLPVITVATAGAAEIVTPDCGIVLPDSEDRQSLAKALARLACDRDLRRRMGQAARAIAERHSWKFVACRYLELFERLSKP